MQCSLLSRSCCHSMRFSCTHRYLKYYRCDLQQSRLKFIFFFLEEECRARWVVFVNWEVSFIICWISYLNMLILWVSDRLPPRIVGDRHFVLVVLISSVCSMSTNESRTYSEVQHLPRHIDDAYRIRDLIVPAYSKFPIFVCCLHNTQMVVVFEWNSVMRVGFFFARESWIRSWLWVSSTSRSILPTSHCVGL